MVEALKYKGVLEEIISTTKLLQGTHLTKYEAQVRPTSQSLILFILPKYYAQVLVYDFLLGKGLQCGGRYKKILHSRKSQLNSALTMMKVKRKVTKKEDLIPDNMKTSIQLPKYLRINTILTCAEDVVEYFRKIGFTHVSLKYEYNMEVQ